MTLESESRTMYTCEHKPPPYSRAETADREGAPLRLYPSASAGKLARTTLRGNPSPETSPLQVNVAHCVIAPNPAETPRPIPAQSRTTGKTKNEPNCGLFLTRSTICAGVLRSVFSRFSTGFGALNQVPPMIAPPKSKLRTPPNYSGPRMPFARSCPSGDRRPAGRILAARPRGRPAPARTVSRRRRGRPANAPRNSSQRRDQIYAKPVSATVYGRIGSSAATASTAAASIAERDNPSRGSR
jgi:hypothetical protein